MHCLTTTQSQLLSAFRDGDHAVFFTLWGSHVSEGLRSQDPAVQRLEFLLNVYYAVYPLFPGTKASKAASPEKSMETFKKFIETRGAALSKSAQFLPYYALPYVPDPRTHPSYREIFADDWTFSLEDRLKKFLRKSLAEKIQNESMAIAADAQAVEIQRYTQEIRALKQTLRDRDFSEEHVRRKLRQLQSDYHNLITIASELVHTLASCINGEKITPTYLSSIVKKLSAFKRTNQEHRAQEQAEDMQMGRARPPPAPGSTMTKHGSKPGLEDRVGQQRGQPMQYIPVEQRLDYAAVSRMWHSDAIDPSVARHQALLIQAFRLRLVRAPSGMSRRAILHSFVSADFLGIRHGKGLILRIFEGQSPDTKYQLARLINVVATDCAGREYILCRGADIIIHMVSAMKRETTDSDCRQNLLGALQKLSLRRNAQSAMNHQKTITYLQSSIFTDIDTLSEYTIEYGSALMMNLCLRTLGKQECVSDPDRTLKTLNELIEHDNIQVKTYVNGTLYSILSEPVIRERARGIGMEEQLKYLRQVSDEQLVKQIDFVIEKLASEEDEEISDTISEDGEEDDTIDDEDDLPVFEDDDADDIVPNMPGELGGDALLETYAFAKPEIGVAGMRVDTDAGAAATDTSRMRGSHASINTVADFRKAVTPSRPGTPGASHRLGGTPTLAGYGPNAASPGTSAKDGRSAMSRSGGLAYAASGNVNVSGATPTTTAKTTGMQAVLEDDETVDEVNYTNAMKIETADSG